VIHGSARDALVEREPSALGTGSVEKLVDAIDNYIEVPERRVNEPFAMPIEDVFSISGRGTVVTGRIDRGRVKVGDAVEAVGLADKPVKSTCTGVEQVGRAGSAQCSEQSTASFSRVVIHRSFTRHLTRASLGRTSACCCAASRARTSPAAWCLRYDTSGKLLSGLSD